MRIQTTGSANSRDIDLGHPTTAESMCSHVGDPRGFVTAADHQDVKDASRVRLSDRFELMQARLRQAYVESTRALVATVEAKDPFTERHSLNVSRHGGEIARRMKLAAAYVSTIETAALLHDIGKIGVPDAILKKPGPLDESEYAIVKKHPSIAIAILEHATFLRNELPIILHHHERFDGAGYPAGLAAERIPLGARILTVVDSLDAMVSHRRYKPAMTLRRAKMELIRCKGSQFDPAVVDATLDWMESAGESIVPSAVDHARTLGDTGAGQAVETLAGSAGDVVRGN